jgi:hypothetical protein
MTKLKYPNYAIAMMLGLALLCAVLIARGADAPKPPQITDAQQIAYFQARAEVAEAQAALTAAQTKLEAAVKAMQAVCPLTLDVAQRPVCQVAPEPKPEAK